MEVMLEMLKSDSCSQTDKDICNIFNYIKPVCLRKLKQYYSKFKIRDGFTALKTNGQRYAKDP